MYDVIVVGARCAGASSALLLARRGYKVLLLDRTSFPSDTISGHLILHPGVQKLAEWGLIERILEAGTPAINHWSMDLGDFRLAGPVETASGLPATLGPRRTVLDQILVQAALEAGAELYEGFNVNELLYDGDRVIGVRGQSKQDGVRDLKATLVIGADGKRSTIAQLVGAEERTLMPTLSCWYISYWRNFPSDGMEINWVPGRVAFAFPTNDGLTSIAVSWPYKELHAFRSDVEANYVNTIAQMPSLRERLAKAERAERIVAMADLPNFFRQAYGKGWALVGDASHHKDPVIARGMSDAFLDAELLADAVDQGLSGKLSMQAALEQYAQQRDARAIPDTEANIKDDQYQGWDTPTLMQLRQALRNNPVDTSHFFAVRARVLPPESFFTPDNLARIMSSATSSP
jgi:flavin-dependent dehydrogenase